MIKSVQKIQIIESMQKQRAENKNGKIKRLENLCTVFRGVRAFLSAIIHFEILKGKKAEENMG